MKRLIFIPFLLLAACNHDKPDNIPNTGDVAIIDPVTFGLRYAGPPNQEIALDFYKTLTAWAKEYPSLRPAIVEAISDDGIVTYGEYDRINKQQEKLALVEGQKEWNKEAEPYRQQVREASKS